MVSLLSLLRYETNSKQANLSKKFVKQNLLKYYFVIFLLHKFRSDVAYYDGIKEVILAAGLIVPKPGEYFQLFVSSCIFTRVYCKSQSVI